MGYIYEERETVEEVVVGGVCDHCAEPIPLVAEGLSPNLDGASIVEMHGWYGGWYDPMYDPNHAWVLCRACSEAIFILLTKGRIDK